MWPRNPDRSALQPILAATAFVALCGIGGAQAQQQSTATAQQLHGHWSLVTVVNEQDGKKTEPFGPNPKGLFIFDPSGRYSVQIYRGDLPKFAAKTRDAGTDEENKAVMRGSLTHFGTYTVNEKEASFTVKPIASSYPNWAGGEQPARKFMITGSELKIMNTATSLGAGTAYLILKRAE